MSVSCISKKIWVLWLQGEANAPFVVKNCINSWKRLNTSWDVIVLDADSLSKYIDLDLDPKIELAHQSDIIRLKLLNGYGGVWVDATAYCNRPLDEWLHICSSDYFFMFKDIKREYGVSNWFIASKKSNRPLVLLESKLESYWNEGLLKKKGTILTFTKKVISYVLHKIDGIEQIWFTYPIMRILKIYPYFVFHYMLANIFKIDFESKIIWDDMIKVSNVQPHYIQKIGMLSELTEEIKEIIDKSPVFVYKLDFRVDESKAIHGTVLNYLFESKGDLS